MKKTVLALLALAGVASSAVTLPLTDCVQGKNAEFILTLNLNVEQVTALLAPGNLDERAEGVIFAVVQSGNQFTGLSMGIWGTEFVCMQLPSNSDQFAAGLDATASSPVTIGGSTLHDIAGGNSSDIEGLDFVNMVGKPVYNWSDVDTAILTLHHDGITDRSKVILTLTVNGIDYQITGTSTNDSRAWDTYGAQTTLSYNTNFVNSASVQVIPEPVTATLSLLALAGLVARRRRK